jgi:hypothetical protein
MSIEHIQHFSDLLHEEVDVLDDRVVEGLSRLLQSLKQRLFDEEAEAADREERYGHLPASTEYDGGLFKTVGELLEMYRSSLADTKSDLDQVRTILFALAVPSGTTASWGHVSRAFEQIGAVISERRYQDEARVKAGNEAYAKRKRESSHQAPSDPPSAAPKASGSSQPPNPKPSAGAPIPEVQPAVEFQHRITVELGPKLAEMRKKELIHYLQSHWDQGSLGPISGKKLDVIATLLRPLEAQKGRANPKA